ncbi:MAG TPA: CRTAC1 family protein [Tepidisphaeraceae bacterium]|jgi:hypothetical protein|nr:CRTAC1 family protein [Tepidisphaeraceae bacterium]
MKISLTALLLLACATARGEVVFTDASDASGLKPHLQGALNHAVAWGDFDGDGLVDLFLGNFDKGGNAKYGLAESIPNRLLRQSAPGKFVQAPMPALEMRGRTSGAVFVDLDNDGDLDLVVANNTHERKNAAAPALTLSAVFRNDGGKFVDVTRESGLVSAFARDVGVLDFDGDGLLDLFVMEDKVFRPVAHSKLYRNLGGFKFEDVTSKVGLPTDLEGFGVAIGDVNEDGRADVFVCGANRLFLSKEGGGFREGAESSKLFFLPRRDAEELPTGAVFGDIDNDGDLDLITGTHFVPSRVRVFLNDGKARFQEVTQEIGLGELPQKAPSVAIADFDNDGLADLYFSAWFAEGEKRTPFVCRGLGVKDGLPRFEVPSVEKLERSGVKKNVAPAAGRGMVYYVDGPPVDYDNDGRLDFFAGIWPDENSKLFHNQTQGTGHWLKVVVQGTKSNRMGIGAKVRVMSDGGFVGFGEIGICGGYSGSGPAVAHFGLGKRERVDVSVVVSGRGDPIVVKDVKVDQVVVVKE